MIGRKIVADRLDRYRLDTDQALHARKVLLDRCADARQQLGKIVLRRERPRADPGRQRRGSKRDEQQPAPEHRLQRTRRLPQTG